MNSKLLKIYITALIFFATQINLNAQNSIDPSGGFVALVPNGNTDDNGWPIGDQYDGANINNSIWRTATNYVATGGSGWLRLGNTDSSATTYIYLGNGITINDESSSGGAIILAESGFNGDLIIETQGNIRLQHEDNLGRIIDVDNANNVTINGGTYDSVRRQNNTGGEYAADINSVNNTVLINDATFYGPDVDQNWVNVAGGTGLQLSSPNNVILNNVTSIGGIGKQRRNGTIDDTSDDTGTWTSDDIGGGNGLIFQGATSANIFATNLTAEAGQAGNFFVSATRVDGDTIDLNSSGGDGISGSSILNILNGTITGNDGGEGSFNSSDGDNFNVLFSASGGDGISGGIGSGILTNVNVTAGDGGYLTIALPTTGSITYTGNGGSALTGSLSDGSLSGNFIAGHGSSDFSHFAGSSLININGGRSINNSGQKVTIQNGTYYAGHGGTNVYISSSDNLSSTSINAVGGTGLFGPAEINSGIFTGGNGGQIVADTANTVAVAGDGGPAVYLTSSDSTILNGIFTGGNGGNITLSNGTALADGGSGLISIKTLDGEADGVSDTTTLTINNGIFTGGNGGRATSGNGLTQALAGTGAQLYGGTNIISGGTFSGGNKGSSSSELNLDIALGVRNAHYLSITNANGNKPLISGDMALDDIDNVNLQSGRVTGKIIIGGSINNFDVSSDLEVDGNFEIGYIHTSSLTSNASVNVNIDSNNDGSVFKNINMFNESVLTFSNQTFKSATDANISINEQSEIVFLNGATLSPGTTINIGLGTLNSDASIVLNNSSSINLNYNGTDNGELNISSGSLDLSASNTKLHLTGSPSNSNGTVNFGILGDNSDTIDQSKITTDFGWLLNTSVSTEGNSSNALVVTYNYNLPSNHISEADFQNTNHYDAVSNFISTNNFSTINALGAIKGSALIKYSEVDEVNTSDGIYRDNQQINNLISARNTEVRSRHGFASSNPKQQKPKGVAGPSSNNDSQIQGWIRSYNARGNYDQTASFDKHKIDGKGTIIGFDKYKNNILTGITIGQSSSKSYSDSVYSSNTDIVNSSLYSTIGGRKNFLDLAFSYSEADTKIRNAFDIPSYKISSSLQSYYVGLGHSFDSFKNIQITPEISYLYSKYEQDGYTRLGIINKEVSNFSSDSKILSTGVNISTQYQIDWFNKGLAMIPEFRLHLLREMNANVNDEVNYIVTDNDPSFSQGTLSVRPREENLFKIGIGLNFWSWYTKNARLELDYDLTTGDTYHEHLISGKVGIKF